MKKFFSLFLVLVMICAILPSAAASTIYTAKESRSNTISRPRVWTTARAPPPMWT